METHNHRLVKIYLSIKMINTDSPAVELSIFSSYWLPVGAIATP